MSPNTSTWAGRGSGAVAATPTERGALVSSMGPSFRLERPLGRRSDMDPGTLVRGGGNGGGGGDGVGVGGGDGVGVGSVLPSPPPSVCRLLIAWSSAHAAGPDRRRFVRRSRPGPGRGPWVDAWEAHNRSGRPRKRAARALPRFQRLHLRGFHPTQRALHHRVSTGVFLLHNYQRSSGRTDTDEVRSPCWLTRYASLAIFFPTNGANVFLALF